MPPEEREPTIEELGESLTNNIQKVITDLGATRESVDKVAVKVETLQRDTLTGLLDRRQYFQSLREKLEREQGVAVIMIDLNHLKYFNDGTGRGHPGGDEALSKLKEVISNIENINYTPFRYAGDEFTIIVEGGEQEAQRIIDEMKRRLQELPLVQGSEFPITVSAGFSSIEEARLAFENLDEKGRAVKPRAQLLSEFITNIAGQRASQEKQEFHRTLLENLAKTDRAKYEKIAPFIVRAQAS